MKDIAVICKDNDSFVGFIHNLYVNSETIKADLGRGIFIEGDTRYLRVCKFKDTLGLRVSKVITTPAYEKNPDWERLYNLSMLGVRDV